jgi:hypothetical protein
MPVQQAQRRIAARDGAIVIDCPAQQPGGTGHGRAVLDLIGGEAQPAHHRRQPRGLDREPAVRRRAAVGPREITEDRLRIGEHGIAVDQHRDLPEGRQLQECRVTVLTFRDADRHRRVRHGQEMQEQLDLVRVARSEPGIEPDHHAISSRVYRGVMCWEQFQSNASTVITKACSTRAR